MKRASIVAAAIVFAIRVPQLSAQDHAHAPADRLGTVHFPTTCSPGVASQFDRAVALLHSFEFGASIRAFNDVLAADSTCAMAHWGIAVSRWGNPMAAGNRAPAQLRQGNAAADEGARLGARASERERGYLAAVANLFDETGGKNQGARIAAYEAAMRDLAARHPGDTEATIFHAIALVGAASPTDKTYANQLKAGTMLEALWEKQPDHPGIAHYIIHTYDYPALASRARQAAQRYATIAPSAAHALHMPSHTFTRVGLWEESIATNLRSMSAALATASIAEALHAADYAVYANLQLGRDSAARAILDSLPALAARFDPQAVTGAAPGSAGVFALASIPARWALERRSWAEAAALEPRASAWPYTEAMTWFARSLGASRTADAARARSGIDSLAAIQSRLVAGGEQYWGEQVGIQLVAARAWLALADRRPDEALQLMREAVRREDLTEKNAVTPGPLAPMRELLGDMLLALDRPREAAAEYRASLAKEPGRRHAIRRLEEITSRR